MLFPLEGAFPIGSPLTGIVLPVVLPLPLDLPLPEMGFLTVELPLTGPLPVELPLPLAGPLPVDLPLPANFPKFPPLLTSEMARIKKNDIIRPPILIIVNYLFIFRASEQN